MFLSVVPWLCMGVFKSQHLYQFKNHFHLFIYKDMLLTTAVNLESVHSFKTAMEMVYV